MADVKISALPLLEEVPDDAVIPVVSEGVTYKAPRSAVGGATDIAAEDVDYSHIASHMSGIANVKQALDLFATGIVNAMVSASAAIAGTKIAPDFGSQNVTTTGYISAALARIINATGIASAVADMTIVGRRTADGADYARRASGVYEVALAKTVDTSSTTAEQLFELHLEADTYAALSLVLMGVNRGTPAESCMVRASLLVRCNGSNVVTIEESDKATPYSLPLTAFAWSGTDYSLLIDTDVATANKLKVRVKAGNSTTVRWYGSLVGVVGEDAAS